VPALSRAIRLLTGIAVALVAASGCHLRIARRTATPDQPPPIEVLIVGTFHFAQVDTLTYDVLKAPRTTEVDRVVDALTTWRPDKIFLEWQPEFNQLMADSLLAAHAAGTNLRRRNEVYQLGIRTAVRLGHPRAFLIDHPGRYNSLLEEATTVAARRHQEAILNGTAPYTQLGLYARFSPDSVRQMMTLGNYLRYLNQRDYRLADQASYLSRYPRIGEVRTDLTDSTGDSRIGTELVADWYRRNLMIYSKTLHWMSFAERRIVIVIGAGHVPILRHLFESHGGFRIVEVADVVRAD
jgi:hypothetical protein